ncbi:VHA-d1 [Symbiodinium natans]|uniref:VHA-d1 protein n=1 Tax=Symbiodinium natans TaxID=878477 RepID=A0A812U2C8_9DINO|nr:VHA-d1 [Symbiodinium natans]
MSESFDVQGGFDDVYRIFLVDTPIGPYFEEYLKEADRDKDDMAPAGIETSQVGGILTKQDLEIMKQSLKKAWLEDFYSFVESQGGTTAEVMGNILKMEADFRVLLVTLNALNTNLSTEASLGERNALYPNFGYLYPEGTKVKDFYDAETGGSRAAPAGAQSIEDLIYAENVRMYEMAFEQQYHFGIFYAWVKLREQEIRNIRRSRGGAVDPRGVSGLRP